MGRRPPALSAPFALFLSIARIAVAYSGLATPGYPLHSEHRVGKLHANSKTDTTGRGMCEDFAGPTIDFAGA